MLIITRMTLLICYRILNRGPIRVSDDTLTITGLIMLLLNICIQLLQYIYLININILILLDYRYYYDFKILFSNYIKYITGVSIFGTHFRIRTP